MAAGYSRIALAVAFIAWQMTYNSCASKDINTVQIRKCCNQHDAWNVRKNGCENLPPQLFFPVLEELIPWPVGENYTVAIGRNCSENTPLQFLNPRDEWHKYDALESGQLRLVNFPSIELDSDAFCIDRANTSYEPIFMACLPRDWTVKNTAGPKLQINKCCPEGQHYVNASCQTTTTNLWLPTVVNDQRLLVDLSQNDWTVNHGFPDCSLHSETTVKIIYGSDLVGPSSQYQYVLYDNGTLYSRRYQILFQPKEFCMDEMLVSNSRVKMIQVCFRDPCVNKTCVNSCCPPHIAMNPSTGSCNLPYAPYPLPIEVKYDNESIVTNASKTDLHEIIGNPLCSQNAQEINFHRSIDVLHVDQFGQSYVILQGKAYANYCVGYYLNRRHVPEMQVKVCSVQSEDLLAIRIYAYLFLTSSVFLLATFLVYATLPELQNIHGMTTMSLVFSLFMAYLCLGIVQITESNLKYCELIATVIHFFFIAAFTWMGTMSFDIMWTFTGLRIRKPGKQQQKDQFIHYSIFAWGVPLIIVTTGQILDKVEGLPLWVTTPNFGLETCWFPNKTDQMEKLRYFYGPVATIIFVNTIFFAITAGHLYSAENNCHAAIRKRRANQRLRVVLSVSVLMGLTWITEVLSWAIGGANYYYWMPTDILNILQAVLIFFIFVWKPKVKRLLRSRFLYLLRRYKAFPGETYAVNVKHQGRANSSAIESGMRGRRNTAMTSLMGHSSK